MGNWLNKLFRIDKRHLARIDDDAEKVLSWEEEISKLTDDSLQNKTKEFKERLENGETLNDIKFEAYAVAREAAKRVIGEFPYKVQIMGALVLNEGDVAEMRTGEGKTLTATMAVYLNALSGDGVHIITVNEYLAKRDAEWMGKIYRFLGLTVGVNLRELTPSEKKAAYLCDITYTTSSEVGFDYLRDNMADSLDKKVLRKLNFALVDECDSILIDEGRTPLIISGGSKNVHNFYVMADKFAKSIRGSGHYTIDEQANSIVLSDSGVKHAEKYFNIENLYALEHTALVHHINQALKANYTMKRDVEYTVVKGEIIIIDQSTGRLMPGRQWSDGLHQAIEAKEGVRIKQETITIATITYQNFFRLYSKLSGMTGTAKTEEEELKEIYNMKVLEIPTNRPIQRVDDNDLVYNSLKAKYKALIEEVKRRHAIGQPILVGTASVEVSELLSEMLQKEKIKHDVLNAKNHEREAEIVAKAGQKGAVTIATNMAGRGTDIKLGEGVRELVDPEGKIKHTAGLAVLGSERNDSRRVDNQLRGRSGRQGDPGYSRFYVSLEDELMRRFGNLSEKKLFAAMGDEAIDSALVTKLISSAQVRVEGSAFDSRKYVLKYDEVLRQQREIMYQQRDDILQSENPKEIISSLFRKAAAYVVAHSVEEVDGENVVNFEKLSENTKKYLQVNIILNKSDYEEKTTEDIAEGLAQIFDEIANSRHNDIPEEHLDDIKRRVALSIVDRHWTQHIDNMQKLRDGVNYMSYAQIDPLNAYINQGYDKFQDMADHIALEVSLYILNMKIQRVEESKV